MPLLWIGSQYIQVSVAGAELEQRSAQAFLLQRVRFSTQHVLHACQGGLAATSDAELEAAQLSVSEAALRLGAEADLLLTGGHVPENIEGLPFSEVPSLAVGGAGEQLLLGDVCAQTNFTSSQECDTIGGGVLHSGLLSTAHTLAREGPIFFANLRAAFQGNASVLQRLNGANASAPSEELSTLMQGYVRVYMLAIPVLQPGLQLAIEDHSRVMNEFRGTVVANVIWASCGALTLMLLLLILHTLPTIRRSEKSVVAIRSAVATVPLAAASASVALQRRMYTAVQSERTALQRMPVQLCPADTESVEEAPLSFAPMSSPHGLSPAHHRPDVIPRADSLGSSASMASMPHQLTSSTLPLSPYESTGTARRTFDLPETHVEEV